MITSRECFQFGSRRSVNSEENRIKFPLNSPHPAPRRRPTTTTDQPLPAASGESCELLAMEFVDLKIDLRLRCPRDKPGRENVALWVMIHSSSKPAALLRHGLRHRKPLEGKGICVLMDWSANRVVIGRLGGVCSGRFIRKLPNANLY